MNATKLSGAFFENWVSNQLVKREYQIIARNYRSPFGEIDIIAIHQNTLVFVEVKARSSSTFGAPFEAVNRAKLTKITNSGHHFRQQFEPLGLPPASRIDVAAILVTPGKGTIEFQLIQNASL